MNTIDHIRTVMLRDLNSLRNEVEAFEDASEVWQVPKGINNSAGTLILHLCGNLRHFIGNALGTSEYARDREWEFSARDLSLPELLAEVDDTIRIVGETLARLPEAALIADYPVKLGERTLNTCVFLIHLCTHLGFHLGQIDYQRRIVTGRNVSISPQSIQSL